MKQIKKLIVQLEKGNKLKTFYKCLEDFKL